MCVFYIREDLLLCPKKAIVVQKTCRKASSILGIRKLKIPHERICCIWLNISFSIVKYIFIWLCPLKYQSPRQIVSKKGNCELKDVKYASRILGNQKSKILHKGTCSVQLNSTFYHVKLVIIWLFPQQFVEYHPHLQFGACHIAPNLAGIAWPHIVCSSFSIPCATIKMSQLQPQVIISNENN
jgi:hypothetical protein